MRLHELTQQRLALFLCGKVSGNPLRRVRVNAEVVLRKLAAELLVLACGELAQLRERNRDLAALFEEEVRRQIEPAWFADWCDRAVIWSSGNWKMRASVLPRRSITRRAACCADRSRALPTKCTRPYRRRRPAHPLGVLASDHIGFVSYDLARIEWRALLSSNLQASCAADIRAYPMLLDSMTIPVLDQYRIAPDAAA